MMNDKTNPTGIILAAGFSSRMKGFKPLMPIGDATALILLINSLKNAGIDDIIVVVGFNADSMEQYLADKGVRIVRNEDYANGMFTSVKAGIKAAGENPDGFLLMLVDSPLIPPYVIKNVVNHHSTNPDSFIVPCYKGKKGHPLYIPVKYRQEILDYDGDGGLKKITDKYFNQFVRLEMNCEGVVLDMDTPENYETLLKYHQENKYPTKEKCLQLLEMYKTPAHVVRHCKTVTDIALRIAYALNDHGYSLDIDLIRAAGLLHDIYRIKKKHWELGAELCRDYGYNEVADIIKVHMSYVHSTVSNDYNETDIICLADRLCIEDKYATIEERMEPVRRRWANNPEALDAIEKRMGATSAVKAEIERVVGRTIDALMTERNPESNDDLPVYRRGRKLFLIRHGETQRHKEPVFMGQIDVPLNSEGREQCARAGIELRKYKPRASKIYCSDLKRSRDSAKIIANILDSKPEVLELPEFREIALGEWDGMFISDVKASFPDEYELRGENILTYKIGNDSENYFDLQYRVMKKFNEIINESDDDIILVGHAGVNKVIMCNLQQKELSALLEMNISRGEIVVLNL